MNAIIALLAAIQGKLSLPGQFAGFFSTVFLLLGIPSQESVMWLLGLALVLFTISNGYWQDRYRAMVHLPGQGHQRCYKRFVWGRVFFAFSTARRPAFGSSAWHRCLISLITVAGGRIVPESTRCQARCHRVDSTGGAINQVQLRSARSTTRATSSPRRKPDRTSVSACRRTSSMYRARSP